jgi:superfamily II DNA/RNA helicase
VAARSIDAPTITHVPNFGLPMKAGDYTIASAALARARRPGHHLRRFRDRRRIYDIESYSRQQFKSEVIRPRAATAFAPIAHPKRLRAVIATAVGNHSRSQVGGASHHGGNAGGFGGGSGPRRRQRLPRSQCTLQGARARGFQNQGNAASVAAVRLGRAAKAPRAVAGWRCRPSR